MFRFPWLAASLAFVVFIFSIEAAATSPPDPYGPVIRDCSIIVENSEELKGIPGCNVVSSDPAIINSCLCGQYHYDVWKQMDTCITAVSDVDWWHDFRCATCYSANYGNNPVVKSKVCAHSKRKMPSKARKRTKMP
ncbi:BZ3500_MvSof-1268-A1-R1_Chr10-1g02656 [Microbotryum saponariae]|uniref:BZ3500_MvSof-1268-A1-R1_Chr10-1g02656 protein n=1 Tax=Microbotryum saponariae TaxID=289078 RepID=A0A2X0MAF7_9BASI|nr:BZ3500_MvSof-1268-A1-R1_Chr10-1g02656 [Microbotryum saponariae]SDA06145.1 BZ3501_MvSof-1269-A2-R1_Chr10-1g02257 [Microbotryum saponariae]